MWLYWERELIQLSSDPTPTPKSIFGVLTGGLGLHGEELHVAKQSWSRCGPTHYCVVLPVLQHLLQDGLVTVITV